MEVDVDAVDEGRKNEEMEKGGKGKGGWGSIDVFGAWMRRQ